MCQVTEEQLMSRKLKACENCEWCIPMLMCDFPHCLLTGKPKGLFETCSNFKERTGLHISVNK